MDYAYIVATPETCWGKPRIAGTRIKVEMIADWVVHLGQAPEEVLRCHPHLTLSQIHSALAYYYDRRAAIEASMQEGRRLAEELRQQGSSVLQKKLSTPEPAKS